MRTYDLNVNDKTFKIKVKAFTREKATLEVNGDPMEVTINNIDEGGIKAKPLPRVSKAPAGGNAPATTTSAQAAPAAASGGAGAVKAPIPGGIMEIFVKEGDSVKAGQPVLKMEAMKMENVINSPKEGVVSIVHVNPGDAVSQGQELMTIA